MSDRVDTTTERKLGGKSLKKRMIDNFKKKKDVKTASKSMKEETKAVKDYSERKEKTEDKELKGHYTHAIKEEKSHEDMFEDWLEEKAKKKMKDKE